MSTYFPSGKGLAENRKWLVVDAKGKTVGRLATEVARILSGKNNPAWTPFMDMGDHCVVINARHAMLGRGGSLTVKAQACDDNAELKLQVIDTGPGIPEKLQARIFEPFFTTKGTARKGETKGTGLGLAICKEIVEHHKGRIEVQSEVGKGTIFTIHLPMKLPPASC